MTLFRYTAIGPGGQRVAGTMDAPTEAEVVARLRRQGSLPVRTEPAAAAGGSGLAGLLRIEFGGRRSLGRQAVAELIRDRLLLRCRRLARHVRPMAGRSSAQGAQ